MARLFILSALLSPALASIISQFSGGKLTGNSFGIAGLNATYDYVIVGGGTAGNVVAARLTEHTNASVAVARSPPLPLCVNRSWCTRMSPSASSRAHAVVLMHEPVSMQTIFDERCGHAEPFAKVDQQSLDATGIAPPAQHWLALTHVE